MTQVLEQQTPSHDFTIWGEMRFQVENFKAKGGDKFAQILCFADVSWSNRWYKNTLLFKLDVHEWQENQWDVQVDYPSFFPYMKPVQAFRRFLIDQMKQFLNESREVDKESPWCPIGMGIMTFVRQLEEFNDTSSVLSQVRTRIETLQRKLKGSPTEAEREKIRRTAFEMLKVLDLVSVTEQPFENKGPML